MSTAIQMRSELDSLKQIPATVAVRDPSGCLRCDISALDSLGVSFQRLQYETTRLAGASIDRIQQVAESLSKRLTYLLEPIHPVEVDAEGAVVQMRSSPPRRDEDGRSYYELVVKRGGRLTLQRFHKEPANPRIAVDATVTREVFVRLSEDLVSVVR